MRNHKKLYRSIAASLLMLFAGLVLAPTLVTAQFQASSKKPVAPAPQVALAPAAPKAVHHHRPSYAAAPISRGYGEQPVPQAGTEPLDHNAHNSGGPTTFAATDFEPIHGGGAAFTAADFGPVHGGGAAAARGNGTAVAAADTGSGIAKVMGKPNSPTDKQTDSQQNDNKQTDNSGAPGNGKPSGSTGGDDQHDHSAGDDKHDHTGSDDHHGEDLHREPPLDPQLADNDALPPTSVPEPSSVALLVAGVIGLMFARRRG